MKRLALLLFAGLLAGCSHLEAEVEVYAGDETDLAKIAKSSEWKDTNDASATGWFGKTEFVLSGGYLDYHVKSASLDPRAYIRAGTNAARTAVRVAAQANFVSVPTSDGKTTSISKDMLLRRAVRARRAASANKRDVMARGDAILGSLETLESKKHVTRTGAKALARELFKALLEAKVIELPRPTLGEIEAGSVEWSVSKELPGAELSLGVVTDRLSNGVAFVSTVTLGESKNPLQLPLGRDDGKIKLTPEQEVDLVLQVHFLDELGPATQNRYKIPWPQPKFGPIKGNRVDWEVDGAFPGVEISIGVVSSSVSTGIAFVDTASLDTAKQGTLEVPLDKAVAGKNLIVPGRPAQFVLQVHGKDKRAGPKVKSKSAHTFAWPTPSFGKIDGKDVAWQVSGELPGAEISVGIKTDRVGSGIAFIATESLTGKTEGTLEISLADAVSKQYAVRGQPFLLVLQVHLAEEHGPQAWRDHPGK